MQERVHMATDEVCELIAHIYPYLSPHVRRDTSHLNLRYIIHEARDGYANEIIDILDRHTDIPGIEETSIQRQYARLLRSILQDSMRGNYRFRSHKEQADYIFSENLANYLYRGQ
jgi:hypothetical protein